MSPDGSSLYLPSENDAFFGALHRDARTGRLGQSASPVSCWKGALASADPYASPPSLPCQAVRGVGETTRWLAVSPDGRSVYVASGPRDEGFGLHQTEALTVFARDPATGALTQLPGPQGCIASAPLDDCAVRPNLSAQSVSVSPDSRHVYAGGHTVTTFARDPSTGALTPQSCLSASATPPCTPTPLALPIRALVFTAAGRFAYAVAQHPPTGSFEADTDAIVAFAVDPATGALSPLPGPGGCATSYRSLASSCTLDRRLGAAADDPVPSPDGADLYVTTTPISYSFPAARGTPFQTVAYRLDRSTGAMLIAGAPCLSSVRQPGCRRDRGLGAVDDLAPSRNGRRLYGVDDTDVVAFARAPSSGALRRLPFAVRGCGDPAAKCPSRRQPINEPHQILVSPDGRFAYVVSSNFGDTGTVAALALR